MPQQALPEGAPIPEHIPPAPAADGRAVRLGRAHATAGASAPAGAVEGVVLLLPDGAPVSGRRPSALSRAAGLPLTRRLLRSGRETSLAVHTVHYRYRGWNGEAAHTAADAVWAAEETVRRYGDVPVCLAGTGVGARAALRAAGHPAVVSVLALAPWLPETEPGLDDSGEEPVAQLAGRRVLLVHGTNDDVSPPERSYRFATRAKKAGMDVARFEVHSDGHALHEHRSEVTTLATEFVLGTLCGRPFSRPLTDALAAPPPLGLRMPLADGFRPRTGPALRH